MAEVDTSFYKPQSSQQQQMSPMQALEMISRMNQLKLFDQTYQSREKIGEAYKRNVGPRGIIDHQNLQTDLGRSGFLAGDAIQQSNQNIGSQFNNQTQQQQHAYSLFGSMAALPNPTHNDVMGLVVKSLRNTNVAPEIIDGILSTMPTDPKKLKPWLQSQALLSKGKEAVFGDATTTPDDQGAVRTTAPGPAMIERTATPAPGATPGAPGTPGVRTGNPTGLEANVARMNAARARAADFGSDIYPMEQLHDKLVELGPTGTGPGANELNTLKSFVQTNLPFLPENMRPDAQKIATFDEAEKYARQVASAVAGGIGHGTDQQLSHSISASPNTKISNLAGVDLAKATIAVRRAEHARIIDADDQKVTPANFPIWSSKWGGNQDIRAYYLDKMTDSQKARLKESLAGDSAGKIAQRKKFQNSYELAIKSGFYVAPEQ